jgi:SNF2 family DNA or RNA helicase
MTRTKNPYELLKYDVVLTTYAILCMDLPRDPKEKGGGEGGGEGAGKPVQQLGCTLRVQWFRVILDEAQMIKNARTQSARACWAVRAKRRWCLSGVTRKHTKRNESTQSETKAEKVKRKQTK